MYDVPHARPPAGRPWWRIITSLLAFVGVALIVKEMEIDLAFLWARNRRLSLQGEDYVLLLLFVVVPLLVPTALLRLKYPLRAGIPRRQQGFRLGLSILFWLGFIDVMGVCALMVLFRGVPG